jgi:uncharacterized membrane protein YedE/YeeE
MTTTALALTTALAGGGLIGLAAALLLGLNGRIFGVSGIAAAAIDPETPDRGWRWALLAGMVSGGALLAWLAPERLQLQPAQPLWLYLASGLAVGYGARLGAGCPSGHGICGLSRLSLRSAVATAVFMATSMGTVAVMKRLGGQP